MGSTGRHVDVDGRGPRPAARDGGDTLAALVAGRPELADRLVTEVLGPLLTLPETQWSVLLDTLEAWIDADGSPGRAAARLHCHRNTVLNRLRRLERATARSVARPRELTELTLALAALRLADREAAGPYDGGSVVRPRPGA